LAPPGSILPDFVLMPFVHHGAHRVDALFQGGVCKFQCYLLQFGIVVLLCGILSLPLSAQTEVMAWSNITGVRVDGELIDFEWFKVVSDSASIEISTKPFPLSVTF